MNDLLDLMHHWKKCPPQHIAASSIYNIIGAYLGVDTKQEKPNKNKTATVDEMRGLMRRHGLRHG